MPSSTASPSPSQPPVGRPAASTPDPEGRFERLFVELAPYVRRVMPRMGVSPADLDDLTQEVFLAVYRGLPTFEGRSSTRTWVYGICIRVCSNYRKRAYRRREQMVAEPPAVHDPNTPERALMTRSAFARLDAALATLPDVQRATFVLHEIERLSVKEIADSLGCSKFTVYARLKVARKRVQVAIADPSVAEVSHA